MEYKNKKLITALLIALVLFPTVLFSAPKEASAVVCPPSPQIGGRVPTIDNATAGATGLGCITTVKQWLQKLLEIAKMAIAKAALEKVTGSIINWINSDFHGQPLFLKNPQSFFKDIVKFEVRKYVDMFGYDLKRFPFGKDFALNLIGSYRSTIEDRTAHTLSGVMSPEEIAAYTNFETGGWNGFFIRTQYPQNNPIGFEMLATRELNDQLVGTAQAPAEKIQSQLQQGLGFLSPQTCPSNPAYNNGRNEWNQPSFDRSQFETQFAKSFGPPPPQFIETPGCTDPNPGNNNCEMPNPAYAAYASDHDAALENAQGDWAKTNTCPGGLQNTTPGSVVGNQISTALTSHIRSKELAMSLGNSLSAIFDALITHFLDKGLSSLTNAISPTPPDNWSYGGITLENNGNGTTDTNPIILPKSVLVNVGQSTSTNISGGTAPYSIKTPPPADVASAVVSGNTLTITGVAPSDIGAYLVVRDSSTPERTAEVRITVIRAGDIRIIPSSVEMKPSDTATLNISGGKGPYSVLVGPDETIASVVLSDTVLVVNAAAPGETSFTIKDSSTAYKTARVNIKVDAPTSLNVNLTANPQNIIRGQSSVLSWTSTGAVSCSPSWLFGNTATSGSSTVNPSSTTTYNITCTAGVDGPSVSNSVTVTVN